MDCILLIGDKTQLWYDNGFVPNAESLVASVEEIPDGFTIVNGVRFAKKKPGRVTFVVVSKTGDVLFRTHDSPVKKETQSGVTYIWHNPIEF